ncbi:MAG: hypothetical protein QE271_10660 [Bacteriovoracaceae bacterium]|nr:hypothetical protein [Bacteriovoracaceae bacterium]
MGKKKLNFFALYLFTSETINASDDGYKIISQSGEQVFSKNCKAKRTWPQISGLADPKIETKLIQDFKQIVTADKKLKTSNCPEKNSDEIYEYPNTFQLGGQKFPLLGVEFVIIFPGGSKRMIRDCRIFDLSTGSKVQLT